MFLGKSLRFQVYWGMLSQVEIANRLDLGGTNCVTDAACASAFLCHFDGD